MNRTDRERLRRDLEAVSPGVSVRFHGAPKCMPSLPKRGSGAFVFRTWGRIVVSFSPRLPLTIAEHDRFLKVLREWDSGAGLSISSGPNDEWPVVEG